MKKHKFILIISIFFVSLILPKIVYGNPVVIEYLNVKVGSSISISSSTNLYSTTGFYFYDKSDKEIVLFQIDRDRIVVSPNQNSEIEIFDNANNYLTKIPGDGTIIIGSGGFPNSLVQVEKNKYRGFITFLVKGSEAYVINHVSIENYLYGVVPRELGPSFPLEALKAQAVASRTYTVYNMNKHSHEGFNLCDTTHCQVYGAYDNEKTETNRAVDETKGLYVLYDGKVANTMFHSTSGGYTEDSSKVWGGTLGYLSAVEDVFSANSPYSSWKVSFTPREISEKLILRGINLGEILNIEVLETTSANRVEKMKIIGTLGEKIISGNELRSILGTTAMKSTWFSVDKEGTGSNTTAYVLDGNSISPTSINVNNAYIIDGKNTKSISRSMVSRAISTDRIGSIGNTYTTSPTIFTFQGRGYGHGVGMSQYGAVEMAKLGYNFEDILKHYYSGVEIESLIN